jgi:hypothetical protein
MYLTPFYDIIVSEVNMNKVISFVLLGTLFFALGCPAKTVVPPTAPTVSPYTKVLAANDALAQSNDAVVTIVTTLNTSGDLNDSQTGTILTFQKQVAQADNQLTSILDKGPVFVQGNSATIIAIINSIQIAGTNLQTEGLIPNSPADVQLTGEISSVVTLATTLLQDLTAAGIIK